MPNIRSYKELRVYQAAIEAPMDIFEVTKTFPKAEKYAMVDQMRRSSRSVCANIAEAWRKRRYVKHFQSKLSDAEAEAAETQVWLELAVRCGYMNEEVAQSLDERYDTILGQLVNMIQHAHQWKIRSS
jgi:four helix bundle protein